MFLIKIKLVFALIFCLLFSQNRVDGIAAIVGNNLIVHSEVLQQTQIIASEQKIDPLKSPYLFENIYFSTLNNLINQYVVLVEAEKDTNLIVTNSEVDKALDQQIEASIKQAGSKKLFLEITGKSIREIKSEWWTDIKNMIIVDRYKFSKIQNIDVSRLEVEQFYDNYKDSIPLIPESYSYSVIEIPFIAGQESELKTINLLNDLKNKIEINNVSFDSLAKLYSHDPGTSQNGGYLGFTKRGSLVKEYETVAFSLTTGEISYPIKTPFGYHIIKLIDRQGEKISTQHILQKIDFSKKDKKAVFKKINDILLSINNNNVVFDSIANANSISFNNFSGVYKNVFSSQISTTIYSELSAINKKEENLSRIFETEKGYALIYLHKYQEEIKPNLKNSWNLIYQYCKTEKQNVFFNDLVNNIKKTVYIKINYN